MSGKLSLWLRHEVHPYEYRTPIVPADAACLVERGVAVTVEDSPQRIFPMDGYAAAGCTIVAAGSWVEAPEDAYVVGLKELPDSPAELRHRHIFFGHAYRGQDGSGALLRRFMAGGGALLDLECLVDPDGRRLAAFGFWAGYVGAALAVLHHAGRLNVPLRPGSRQEFDRSLAAARSHAGRAVVIGALGRCGRGACAALAVAGVETTCWDLAETRQLDRAALLGHPLLVNAVLTTEPVAPFLTAEDVADPTRRLSVIADVTCDVTSPYHALPIYRRATSWDEPVLRLPDLRPPVDVISIDNLPSLLPAESSAAFSADLLPQLFALDGDAPVWRGCLRRYHDAVRSLDPELAPGELAPGRLTETGRGHG
jgi:saccharopine dehydrogenase (NAD+, L-lysine forming)